MSAMILSHSCQSKQDVFNRREQFVSVLVVWHLCVIVAITVILWIYDFFNFLDDIP